MNLPVIRASSMTLAAKCPASIAPDANGVAIDSFDPTSTTGNDVHRAIALSLQGKPVPELDAETEKLVGLAEDWVNNWLKPNYPHHRWFYELSLAYGWSSGTLDVAGRTDNDPTGIVVDWKNTFRDDDHSSQVITYAHLLLQSEPSMQSVTVYVPMLRLGKADQPLNLPREWVMSWMKEFEHNTLRHPEIYRPGEWCTRCRRKVTCPALLEMHRQTIDVFSDHSFEAMLTRENLPALRVRVKLIEEAIDTFKAFQKETILEQGPLPLGNGKILKAVEVQQDEIDIQKGWGVITGWFADSDLPRFVSVAKTEMLAMIGAQAPRGTKGKAQLEFMDRLEEAGAVSKKTVLKILESKE